MVAYSLFPKAGGSSENANGLFGQYLPKGLDIPSYSQGQLDEIEVNLDDRPRKTLRFKNPAETDNECVASTG